MKKTLFIASFIIVAWSGVAQEAILQKNSKGVIESVEFSTEDKRVAVPETAEGFLKDMLKIKSTDEFRKKESKQMQKEFSHEHFEQYYKGVKVEGAGYNFHYKNGRMYFAHGHYVSIDHINVQSSISEQKATENFAIYKNIPFKDVDNYLSELIIKEIPTKTDTLPMLVYKIYLYADHRNNTEIGFVNAHTGDIVFTEAAFIDFSATGTFATRYSGTRQAITHNYQGGYHLVDSTRAAIIHTWNLEGRTNRSGRVELTDNDNNWTQSEHRPNNNDMGLDVHWALQNIIDRLATHGINSMDNNGFAINAHIRYDNKHDNAYWISVERVLCFGEGGSDFYSLASVDVVAHEFGHGITEFQIGWGSAGDQRAFSEGMSDIWGVIMENRIRPNSVWQIGEQLTKNYSCLRNIENPKASNAMTKIANTFGSTQYNSGDSYVRGGIFSHWFYLLTNGGTGTNDLGRSYTTYGVGINTAEELIVNAVFGGYLRNTTSYDQIRTSTINAARAIAGTNSFLVQQVENAWYAVGVGNTQYQYSISGQSTVCDQTSYTINIPQGASIEWTASKGNLTLVSGQGTGTAVFKKYRNGSDIINVNINFGGSRRGTITKNVYFGAPVIQDVVGPLNTPNGKEVHYEAIIDWLMSTPSEYEWILNPQGRNSVYPSGRFVYIAFYDAGEYQLVCRAKNSCGTGDYLVTRLSVYNTSSSEINIYPNPAKDIVNVSLKTDATLQTKDRLDGNTSYEFQLWSSTQLIKKITTNEASVQISVSDLPKGLYFVLILKDGQIHRGKLLVE